MPSSLKLFSGSSSPTLGVAVAHYLDIPLGNITLSQFSSNESYVRIEETIRGMDVHILQSIGENPNDDLMELFIIMDAVKRSAPKSVTVVMPYFGYARQDKKSAPREPITARLIADLMTTAGLDRLITLDLHADQVQGYFSIPVDHLTARPLFIDYFSKKKIQDWVVVATDTGRAKVAKKFADQLGADLAIMHKSRPEHNVAEIVDIVGNIEHKTALLIDDMIDTGGSVSACVDVLRKSNCNPDIYLAATHPIFSGSAPHRLAHAGFREVVVTDTVPLPKEKRWEGLTVLSIASILGEAVRRNFEHKSMSSMFSYSA